MTTTDSRAEFEKWMGENYSLIRKADGDYFDAEIQQSWLAWQAALTPPATAVDARKAAAEIANWLYNPGRDLSVQEPGFVPRLSAIILRHISAAPSASAVASSADVPDFMRLGSSLTRGAAAARKEAAATVHFTDGYNCGIETAATAVEMVTGEGREKPRGNRLCARGNSLDVSICKECGATPSCNCPGDIYDDKAIAAMIRAKAQPDQSDALRSLTTKREPR